MSVAGQLHCASTAQHINGISVDVCSCCHHLPCVAHTATHQRNHTGGVAPKKHLRILEDCPHHALCHCQPLLVWPKVKVGLAQHFASLSLKGGHHAVHLENTGTWCLNRKCLGTPFQEPLSHQEPYWEPH